MNLFREHGYAQVQSFGTGSAVRLPGYNSNQIKITAIGPTPERQNVFAFGTPYTEMHTQLSQKDIALYTQNGLLKMLERNMLIKSAPEKFQDAKLKFELVITCNFFQFINI